MIKSEILRSVSFFLAFSLFCIFNIQGPLELTQGQSNSTEWRASTGQPSVVINVQESSELLTAFSRRSDGGRFKSFDTLAIFETLLFISPSDLSSSQFVDSCFPSKPFLNLEILSSRNHPPTFI